MCRSFGALRNDGDEYYQHFAPSGAKKNIKLPAAINISLHGVKTVARRSGVAQRIYFDVLDFGREANVVAED